MSKIGRLFAGEWQKIWMQKASWVLLGVMILVNIGFACFCIGLGPDTSRTMFGLITEDSTVMAQMMQNDNADGGHASLSDAAAPSTDWKTQAQQNITAAEQAIPALQTAADAGGMKGTAAYATLTTDQRVVNISQYQLNNNIAPIQNNTTDTMWIYADAALAILFAVSLICTVVVGSGTVAQEFSDGTIKLLIARPFTRWKILTAKFLATLGYGIIFLIVAVAVAIFTGGLLYGFAGGGTVVVACLGLTAFSVHVAGYVLLKLLYTLGTVLMISAMAFMFSVLLRGRALAITIALVVYLIGPMVGRLLASVGVTFLKYTFLLNMNLNSYFTGNGTLPGMSLGFSALVMLVYFVICLLVSFWVFQKRDI